MLVWALMFGAVLCLIYFIILVYHVGITTSFVLFWLISSIFLGSISHIVRLLLKDTQKDFIWFPVSLVTLCVTATMVVLVLQVMIVGQVPNIARTDLDYAIVLGAGVKDENISTTLKLRLDKAAEYAKENPETILILSGGLSDDSEHPESYYMYHYLKEIGVSEERMIQESEAQNTVENIAYSKLLAREGSKIGIISSNFHLFRAELIANKQGLSNVYTIGASSDPVLFFHYCVRDAIAIIKDRLMGNL